MYPSLPPTSQTRQRVSGTRIFLDLRLLDTPWRVTPPPTDIDLALLAAVTWTDGTGDFTTDDDCFYANCQGANSQLDWGDPGDADDPELVQDDIEGTGPEVIVYPHPLPERYRVVVHDWANNMGEFPGNLATVEIYAGGVLMFSDTRSVGEEGQYQDVAFIDWASFTFGGS